MTLPRKGRRTIEVEGTTFSFSVGTRKIHSYGPFYNTAVVLTVLREPGPGRALQCLRASVFEGGQAFTPGGIRKLILKALEGGWKPDEAGAAYEIYETPDSWWQEV